MEDTTYTLNCQNITIYESKEILIKIPYFEKLFSKEFKEPEKELDLNFATINPISVIKAINKCKGNKIEINDNDTETFEILGMNERIPPITLEEAKKYKKKIFDESDKNYPLQNEIIEDINRLIGLRFNGEYSYICDSDTIQCKESVNILLDSLAILQICNYYKDNWNVEYYEDKESFQKDFYNNLLKKYYKGEDFDKVNYDDNIIVFRKK